jgi:hypothetical protein
MRPRASSRSVPAAFARLCLCVSFAACTAAGAAPQRDWPPIPSPPDASTFWIAEYLEQNTVPMQIRGFETRVPLSEVVRYYEKWFADKSGYGASELGPARVLGARMGAYQVTVQLWAAPTAAGVGVGAGMVTKGRLVAAVVYEDVPNPEERVAHIGRGFPRPAGSQVISDTLSFDRGQRNRTVMITNGVSVETNALYLREQMLRLGWTLVQDRTIDGGLRSGLVFRRAQEEMVVTIARRDTDYIVIASQTSPDADGQ